MEKKLGLSALTALVLSSMLGAGVFSLPQNMAAVASPAALLIGWGITGAGILLLAFAMLILTRIRPELDGGIFTYAREGFGELIGFCSAWGYWLCAVIANVSYLVIVFSALSFFTDTPELRLFGDGNTWQSIVGASTLLWIVHFLILRGVQTAASINLVATLAKLLPLGLFVVLAMMMFKLDTFKLDFTGLALGVPVWELAEKPGAPLTDVLACMMQIHVNTPYLLNHALERLLRGHGHAASDIIHFTDYVVERGSDKHIAYAASKAALDNMTRSFARKLAPEVKVNSIAPSLILFNEHDDAEYRQQALNKSLMKTAPGEKEVIDLVDYLLTSCFVTGRSFPLDGGRHLR